MTSSLKRALVALSLASCALVGAACGDDDGADVRNVGDTTASEGSGSSGSESGSSGAGSGSATGTGDAGAAGTAGEEAACEAPPEDDTSSVEVAMSDFDIEAAAEAAAGEVVFTVRNDGGMTHQLAVYRGSLPSLEQSALDEAELVAEVEALPAGASCNQTIPLEAGTYTLVCLVPGHAEAGMASELVVS